MVDVDTFAFRVVEAAGRVSAQMQEAMIVSTSLFHNQSLVTLFDRQVHLLIAFPKLMSS